MLFNSASIYWSPTGFKTTRTQYDYITLHLFILLLNKYLKVFMHLLCPSPALDFLFSNNHNRQDSCPPEAYRIMEGADSTKYNQKL